MVVLPLSTALTAAELSLKSLGSTSLANICESRSVNGMVDLRHASVIATISASPVLAAVHDLELARRAFTHAVLLDTTLIATGPVRDVLTPAHIDRAFRQGRCVHDNPLHSVRSADFPR